MKFYRTIVLIINTFLVGFIVGCTPASSQPASPVTLLPPTVSERSLPSNTSTPTEAPSKMTPTPTTQATEIPTEMPTPNPNLPIIQLTFVQDRPCRSCSYGIASDLWSIDVGCLESDSPCLGTKNLLFSWDEWITGVDWSPDGSLLIFESIGALFIAEWNGGNVIQIPSDPGRKSEARWSPDGNSILYIFKPQLPGSDALGPSQIQLFEIDSGNTTILLKDIFDPSRLEWLPGGEIAYVSFVSETDWTKIIRILGPDGEVIFQFPEKPRNYSDILGLSYSPDTKNIVFVGETASPTGNRMIEIYLIDSMKNSVDNLTNGAGYNFDPTWAPLGEWVAFASDRDDDWNIYLIKPETSQLIQITTSPSSENLPAWRTITTP